MVGVWHRRAGSGGGPRTTGEPGGGPCSGAWERKVEVRSHMPGRPGGPAGAPAAKGALAVADELARTR